MAALAAVGMGVVAKEVAMAAPLVRAAAEKAVVPRAGAPKEVGYQGDPVVTVAVVTGVAVRVAA